MIFCLKPGLFKVCFIQMGFLSLLLVSSFAAMHFTIYWGLTHNAPQGLGTHTSSTGNKVLHLQKTFKSAGQERIMCDSPI